MTPQRPYRKMQTDTRAKLKMRHASHGKTDCTVSRERMTRPYGAAPRIAREWQ